ncbi:MAG TPA: ATP-NAD kinase [Eubacteriaceae bacterium]|nr:ATP-NAD kinase [Eubacteriaceae bacterium]
MKKIGIIANPNSGKDIRRIFSYALTIGNNEKANMIERMISSAHHLGVDSFYMMPDSYEMGGSIKNTLENRGDLSDGFHILDMNIDNNWKDTMKALELFQEEEMDVLIVMGGDGTSRLVAKSGVEIPLIAISTGTNNVYPDFSEGTIVGMAAAVVAEYGIQPEYVQQDKVIEIYRNGSLQDVAVVYAVITDNEFIGSRALWDTQQIKQIIVALSAPENIGFSSVIGITHAAEAKDDYGYRVTLNAEGSRKVLVPFGAGKMQDLVTDEVVTMKLGEKHTYQADHKGTLALDGERTVLFKEGDKLDFVIERKGPHRVSIKKALDFARKKGFFKQ